MTRLPRERGGYSVILADGWDDVAGGPDGGCCWGDAATLPEAEALCREAGEYAAAEGRDWAPVILDREGRRVVPALLN